MIFILKNADFSAHNIGTISLNRSLQSETKQVLRAYTRVLTDAQKYAVDDFILGLKDSGILTACSHLYMPILAGDLSECGYNVKTNAIDFVPDAQYYMLKPNKGIVATNTSLNVPTNNRMIVYFNGSQMNHHWMWMPTEVLGVNPNYLGLGFFRDSNAQRFVLPVDSVGNAIGGTLSGNVSFKSGVYIGNENTYEWAHCFINSFGTDGITGYNYTAGNTGIKTVAYPDNTQDLTYTNEETHLLHSAGNPCYIPIGAFSIGIDLSDVQIEMYVTLCKNLKMALL